jgi:TonB family protein
VAAGAAGSPAEIPAFEPPQLLRAPRPAYPPIARNRRRTATVELKVRVDAAGRVISADPVGVRAGYGFDESAQEAAMSAQFRPGRREGVPVESETRLAIRFILEGPPP